MKNITSALQTFLLTAREFVTCDLLTITLNNGSVYYYTDADRDIVWGGNTYSSGGGNLIFTRSKTSSKIGVTVAEMDMDISATPSALIGGVPFIKFFRNSGLDGATVRLDRLFGSDWNTLVGICNNFLGRVSTVEVSRLTAKIKVKSFLVLLDVQLPKNHYQPTCLHSLYDAGCTLNRASFSASSTVTSGSTVMVINSGLANPANYFTQGYVQFTSGANNGERRTVLGYSGGTFNLAMPLLNAPAGGDTFTAYAGCDHTSATCSAKFSNMANFRAFEFIPVPETAL